VIGAWIGGLVVSPIWSTLFFAIGAGAIVQVVLELVRLFLRRPGGRVLSPLNSAGLMAGLLLMYGTGLLS
jgi:ZIP family zinc transporter